MKSTLSFSLSESNALFLRSQKNMSAFLDRVLALHRKYLLWKGIQEGFASQNDEDATLAEEGFDDFVRIITDTDHAAV